MAGKGKFDFNPEAVRGFAEVFNQAKAQVEQIKGTVAATTAKAPDFGKSWQAEGAEFDQNMQLLANDLGNLATNLGNIAASLMQGTDLTVGADTDAYTGLRTLQERLGGTEALPGNGGKS